MELTNEKKASAADLLREIRLLANSRAGTAVAAGGVGVGGANLSKTKEEPKKKTNAYLEKAASFFSDFRGTDVKHNANKIRVLEETAARGETLKDLIHRHPSLVSARNKAWAKTGAGAVGVIGGAALGLHTYKNNQRQKIQAAYAEFDKQAGVKSILGKIGRAATSPIRAANGSKIMNYAESKGMKYPKKSYTKFHQGNDDVKKKMLLAGKEGTDEGKKIEKEFTSLTRRRNGARIASGAVAAGGIYYHAKKMHEQNQQASYQ